MIDTLAPILPEANSDNVKTIPKAIHHDDLVDFVVWTANHEFIPFFHWSHEHIFYVTKQGVRVDLERPHDWGDGLINPHQGTIFIYETSPYAGMVTLSNCSNLSELGFSLVQLWEKTAELLFIKANDNQCNPQHLHNIVKKGNDLVGKLSKYDCNNNIDFNTSMRAIGEWIKASSRVVSN